MSVKALLLVLHQSLGESGPFARHSGEGRTERGEHPKDGPEGVSEANHPVPFPHQRRWIPAFAGMTVME
jgi:hypothetical protein